MPSGKLWKNYNILYVSVDADDSRIAEVLKDNGISDFICYSNQYLPVNLNSNSIELSLFRANYDSPYYSYYAQRNSYFFDKSNSYKIYYVPSHYKNRLNSCLSELKSYNIAAFSDLNSSYPWYLIVIVIIIAALLLYFSRNRLVFCISGLYSILFLICNPYFSTAVGSIILLLSLYFISNIWKRAGFFKVLLNNYYILILLVSTVFCNFGSSIKAGLLYFVCLAGCFCILTTLKNIEDYFDSKISFNPVLIKSAAKKSLFAGQGKIISFAITVSIVFCFTLLFVTSAVSSSSRFSKVLLPSPKGALSQNLPSLEDYCKWNWNIKTAPYISLNQKADNFQTEVDYPRFSAADNKVTASYDKLFYDENFKNQVISDIDSLNFNALEKVLKNENLYSKGAYASADSVTINIFGIITMLFSLFLLIFLLISIIIGKGIVK